MQHRGFIAIVFVIGCATGSVASQLVVPKARAGTTPTRWEYLCKEVDDDEMALALNKAGAEGWELTTMTQYHRSAFSTDFVVCAKRALP